MRFHVLTAATVWMALFWDVALCSLVETDRLFRCAYCIQHEGVMMETVSNSELCVDFYQSARGNIP
jgi:hypothetical protein